MLTELNNQDRVRLLSAGFKQLWEEFEFLQPCCLRVFDARMQIVLPDYCIREGDFSRDFICAHPIADAISNHWTQVMDCCYLWLGALHLDVCFADGSVAWGQPIRQVRISSI